jgi:hypothetical protein
VEARFGSDGEVWRGSMRKEEEKLGTVLLRAYYTREPSFNLNGLENI